MDWVLRYRKNIFHNDRDCKSKIKVVIGLFLGKVFRKDVFFMSLHVVKSMSKRVRDHTRCVEVPLA